MRALWGKDLQREKNVTITFQYRLTPTVGMYMHLAASNLYRLFIEGVLVGYGPARAAHGYCRLDKYSLEKWIGQEVVISAEVYSANINTYYIVDELPFFAAEIIAGEKCIATSEDFIAYRMTERIQKVHKFSFQRAFTEIYRWKDNPAAFYAGETAERMPLETETVRMNRILPRYVSYPRLEKLTANVLEEGQVEFNRDCGIGHRLEHWENGTEQIKGFCLDEIEEDSWAEAEAFAFKRSEAEQKQLDAMRYRIYDFGRSLTGFFSLEVEARKDTTLYILFDEVMTEKESNREMNPFRNNCCNVVKYTLAAGKFDLLTYEANTARFATVVITEGEAELKEFGMVLYENPDVADFQYDFGDERLNKIVGAAVNTFAQNAVDVLTDCPSRERAGWLCDSYFSSRAEALFTGKNLVEKSFLENYALCPQSPFLPDGMIPMCYPADHNNGVYIPNWTMWYILELRNYWKRTGDADMIVLSKEKVFGLVKFFEKYYNEYGLLENLESWVFIEWSKCNDEDYIRGINYPSNILWAAALEAVAEMYSNMELAIKAADMKKTIRELAWNGEFFEDNAVRDSAGNLIKTGHKTETCQYYAFYFNTASREEYRELFDKMVAQFGPKRDPLSVYPDVYPSNAIVGNYLRLELLLRVGYLDQVLTECCDFFLRMSELTGTLWEHSRLDASLNHGFASMAAVYIDECMKRKADIAGSHDEKKQNVLGACENDIRM